MGERQYIFKVFEEDDPALIKFLDSKKRRDRSFAIRELLRLGFNLRHNNQIGGK